MLQKHLNNDNLSQNKIKDLLESFESNKFHTALIEKLCSKLSIPKKDSKNIIDQILSFLEFIKENNVSQFRLLETLLSRISLNKNSLSEWVKNLSKQILKDRFRYNGENGCKLLEAGWDLRGTQELIEEINSKKVDTDIVKQTFDIISGYRIQKDFNDSSNTTINSIFKNYKPSEWIKKLQKLAISANFSSSTIEKDIVTLLKDINESNPEINISKLENQYNEINNHYECEFRIRKEKNLGMNWV